MKHFITLLIAFSTLSVQAQNDKYLGHVTTIDTTIKTLYDVISGAKGEERDWELMKYLFHPDAKLIPTGMTKDTIYRAKYMTVEDYITNSSKFLVENGFFEFEINREVQQFGHIAHVFSTYECFKTLDDKKAFMRGMNSIQLIYDNNRWWIINIYWAQESPFNRIPREYLPGSSPNIPAEPVKPAAPPKIKKATY